MLHLVEVDLLRTEPKPMAGGVASDYRIWSAVRIAALQNCIRLQFARRCRAFVTAVPGDQEPVVDA